MLHFFSFVDRRGGSSGSANANRPAVFRVQAATIGFVLIPGRIIKGHDQRDVIVHQKGEIRGPVKSFERQIETFLLFRVPPPACNSSGR